MIWVGKRVIMPSQWTLESFELHENTPISISLSTLVMRLLPKAETTFLLASVRYGEQKIAQFRTHDLTKVLSYVSTQSQH